MATPSEILEEIKEELENSPEVPDSVSYILQEYDAGGIEANVSLPVIQLQTISALSLNNFNTDFVGYKRDKNGNEIGRVYHSEYTLTIQLDILTVDNRTNEDENISSLVKAVRAALYKFDSAGPAQTLNDSVWKFQLDEGERADNLQSTPTVRRWVQDIDCWSYEEFDTQEDYIVDVTFPDDQIVT